MYSFFANKLILLRSYFFARNPQNCLFFKKRDNFKQFKKYRPKLPLQKIWRNSKPQTSILTFNSCQLIFFKKIFGDRDVFYYREMWFETRRGKIDGNASQIAPAVINNTTQRRAINFEFSVKLQWNVQQENIH